MFISILKELCKERNIKLTPLLKELGISTSLGKLWKDGSIPNGKTLVVLADYFNVSIDYLLGRTPVRNTFADKALLTEKQQEVLAKIGDMPPEVQEKLLEYIDFLQAKQKEN